VRQSDVLEEIKMKNFFTLIMAGLISVSAFASDITVTFTGNKTYQVLIDGRSINNYGTSNNTIYLNNLRSGQHYIQVYKSNGNSQRDNKVTYAADFTVRPQYDLLIAIDKKGRVSMNETASAYNSGNNNDRWNNGNSQDRRNNRNHADRRYDNNRNDRNGRHDDDDDDDRYDRNGNYQNGGYDNGRNNNGGYGQNNGGYNKGGYGNGYNQAVSSGEFQQLVANVRSEWFASGKLNIAKQGIGNYYFTTSQVGQLMQLFSSDNDKLELAKLAYSKTVDPNNYTSLYNLFSIQSSRDELNAFIRGQRY
jgi:hypothetical protein